MIYAGIGILRNLRDEISTPRWPWSLDGTAQSDNFGGFMEACRQLPAFFHLGAPGTKINHV